MRKTVTVIVGSALVVGGCSELAGPDAARSAGRRDIVEPGPSSGAADLLAVQRASVGVELLPGGAIRVARFAITAKGVLPTRDLELRMDLPELASARSISRKAGEPPRLMPPTARVSTGEWRAPLATGGEIRRVVTERIDEPGYYRVAVRAIPRSAEAPSHNGAGVQDVAYAEYWLHATDTTFTLSDRFDPALAAASAPLYGSSGPSGVRQRLAPLQLCTVDEPDCQPPSSPPPSTEPARFRVLYIDPGAPSGLAYVGLPGARVSYSTGLSTVVVHTDADGYFTMPSCPAPGTTRTFRVTLENGDVRIRAWLGMMVGDAFPALEVTVGSETCGQLREYVTGVTLPSVLFANVVRTVGPSRVLLGRARGLINVGYDYRAGRGAAYFRDSDIIVVGADEIAGERGVFVAAHEYGHAVHEAALGGIRGGGCPVPHYFEMESSTGCAYSEGFANFLAAATRGSEAGYYHRMVESPLVFREGAASEMAVAAFYYDLIDPPNEPHDLVQYPGSYLADLIRTCEIYPIRLTSLPSIQFIWQRTDAVDGIIYCAERGVDGAAQLELWQRSPRITGMREAANEPGGATQRQDVRRLWRANLYGRQ